ncbi:FAD-binding oxidoreductase [Tautonia sociabilis]|uniref:FAD-binding oxidoreductase n=1 Tax=Tautonia sociabilis TaxID=2080755 RepID=A0A432MRY1_9BACT|nr:FAD-binding oxidoreductase [Tautonia sociabilis]RUL89695.1 FAD-binding oxidoreductase [Tautonia sociabilis]
MNWPDSPNDTPLGDGRFASAVERPTDRQELADALGRLAAEGIGLYPQGGRTALECGGIPARPGVAIDVTGLSRVVDYPAADMTITVEAGLTLAELQRTLGAQGQRLPLEAPAADLATIGGVFATDSSGPRRFGNGRPRDLIIGVAFASSKGELVKGGGRVVKNVAGYDLPKLLTGSMGSLGVIVELTLKTRPRPEATALCWSTWPGMEPLEEVLGVLNTSRTRPVALELLNGPAAEAVARRSGLDLPAGGVVLAVGLEGTETLVSWQLDVLEAELGGASGLVPVRGSDADRLWGALTDHPAGGLALGGEGEASSALSFKANLLPSSVVAFVESIDPGRWEVQSHAGNGIVWGLGRPGIEVDRLAEDVTRLREAAVSAGGNLILPRCPTDRKPSLGIWGAPRGDWELARMVKRAIDPAGAMNPGRFL